ncbi:3-phosphoshikimate 1-carboxyvinyltransferase [Ornithinimicrobium cerasi]|uniref:3-phosphoshikimate 1-carboxyvinyltransferase n=1 Tax=Ornithinimicrobium cerasi TaxID=2248773 RepID=UPI000F0090FC|nr:3-phosphoshikimate 1-carboxyvinyltransferase [Ornithinimicrobium cerasi]
MTPPSPWAAPYPGAPVDAVVHVPGSKSLTNRWLVLAALADGPCTIRRPLRSRDSERMVDALRGLGCHVDDSSDEVWSVVPAPVLTGGVRLDAGQAGTVMRFVPPLAAMADGPVLLDGHETARTRPVGPVLEALRSLGVQVDDGGRGTMPFTVHGRGALDGGEVTIDASASSQFVSALLLAAARFRDGLTLRHRGVGVPSAAHLDMTLQVLEEVGVRTSRPDARTWRVEHGPVRAFDRSVEPDLSSAAPFLALAAVTGGRVTVRGWPPGTTQPGAWLPGALERMGARCRTTTEGLEVRGPEPGTLHGVDHDLSDVGELTPVVAALAVLADRPGRLSGIAHLRGHETDRLDALVTEITRLGGRAEETEDGLVVDPTPLHGAELQTYHDHRMAMFAAVVGAAVPGVRVVDVATADKTFPGFDVAWERAAATRLEHPGPSR